MALWHRYTNRNVLSDRLKLKKDMSAFHRPAGRLFQILGHATEKARTYLQTYCEFMGLYTFGCQQSEADRFGCWPRRLLFNNLLDVADELTIVSQVFRSRARQRPIHEGDQFELNSLANGQPVQLTQDGGDVDTSYGAG